MLPALGTVPWFKFQSAAIKRAAHALDSLASAQRFADKLVQTWSGQDPIVTAALHTSAVIDYCKAFTEQPEYPSRHLRKHAGFDPKLHRELLDIRQKLIAHSDKEYTASELNVVFAEIGFSIGDQPCRVQFPKAGNVRTTTLNSLADPPIAERYALHIAAGVLGTKADATEKLESYLQAAAMYPTACEEAGTKKQTTKRVWSSTSEIGQPSSIPIQIPRADQILPPPDAPMITVRDGYSYRTTGLTVELRGEIDATGPGGIAIKITIKKGPDDAMPIVTP